MNWNAKKIDAAYEKENQRFMEGEELAALQGIPDFIEEHRRSRIKDALAAEILETAQSEETLILDAGCGNGWFPLRLAATRGFRGRLICVDVSHHNTGLLNQQIAERGLERLMACQTADCERLPFKDSVFDLIYSTESMEHMREPANFLKEAARTLKPGGRLLITTPSGTQHEFWKRLANIISTIRHGGGRRSSTPPIYERTISKRRLRRYLNEAGLAIREHRSTVLLPHESCFQFLPIHASKLLLSLAETLERLPPFPAFCALHQIAKAEKPVEKQKFSTRQYSRVKLSSA